MIDYPKMLYKGNQTNYVHIIVDDEHEEQAALQAGYVEYGELNEAPVDSVLPDDDEEYIVELQLELEQLQAENAELREQLAAYENQRTDEQAQTTDDTAGTNAGSVDYSEWTNSQLQKAIVDAGKTYNKRDSKAELINILQG